MISKEGINNNIRRSARALPLVEDPANRVPPDSELVTWSHAPPIVGRDAFFSESPIALVLNIPFQPLPFPSLLSFLIRVEDCRTASESFLEGFITDRGRLLVCSFDLFYALSCIAFSVASFSCTRFNSFFT